MELELGLALPSANFPSEGHGLDLNGDDACATPAAVHKKKRGLMDAFGGDNAAITTLPLFHWPSTHDDNSNNNNGGVGYGTKADYNGTTLVGWPPVKPTRKNGAGAGATRYVKVKMEGVAIGRKVDLLVHYSYTTLLDALDRLFIRNRNGEGGQVGLGGGECGPPPLTPASCHHRTFTYQDGDGDWMLLGDVPWETFIKSAKRLKIFGCSA